VAQLRLLCSPAASGARSFGFGSERSRAGLRSGRRLLSPDFAAEGGGNRGVGFGLLRSSKGARLRIAPQLDGCRRFTSGVTSERVSSDTGSSRQVLLRGGSQVKGKAGGRGLSSRGFFFPEGSLRSRDVGCLRVLRDTRTEFGSRCGAALAGVLLSGGAATAKPVRLPPHGGRQVGEDGVRFCVEVSIHETCSSEHGSTSRRGFAFTGRLSPTGGKRVRADAPGRTVG